MWTPLRASQLFLRLQLPFLLGVLFFSAAVALTAEVEHTALLIAGAAVTVVASALFLVRGAGWAASAWIVVIPILDIVAVAFARAAMLPYLPTIGLLCLFPFAWIAYRFRWPGLLLVLAGSAFISALPFVVGAAPVSSGLAVLNLVALPLLATGISLGIHLGSVSYQRSQEAVNRSRLEASAALARSRDGELLLRSLLDTVSGAVAFFDADGRPSIANAAAEQWGRRAGLHEPDRGSSARVLAADKATPVPFEQRVVPKALRGETVANQLEWIGEPGDMIALMATSRRILREDGALLGTVVAAYDVTELAEAVEVREQFLATVSHELRTPLTSIMGYTEYVTDELGDRAGELGVERALATISRNTEKLLDRVSQLLSAADKNFDVRLLPIDLVPVLQASFDSLRVIAANSGVELIADLPEELPVDADGPRLAQAVENLLTNAIKFTPALGTVRLGAAVDGTETVITVSDTGVGMSGEEQRRAFDRFYRSRGARDTSVQGIGVGLAIVKQIVDAHCGHVEVRSVPGEGTEFTLRLPSRQL
ncbi:two-component sensor histidine kinase [Arenivirga flava]|uniref:histidine kinase n=1 Tax=Arenivirga flava TaxID=1930060 RepID=A0AA37UKA4_9MICO|nr:two-component sensor histidine kinase [Arenivirga flava]